MHYDSVSFQFMIQPYPYFAQNVN